MIIGHEKIFEYFKRSVKAEKFSHAYLFSGQSNLGKRHIAYEFAKMLECDGAGENFPCDNCRNCLDAANLVHPDVTLIEPDLSERSITIKSIRELRRVLSLHPYEGKLKIAILDDAHKLTLEAANSLLKILEEPRGKTVIILISSSPFLLPETILSRLEIIKFHPVDSGKIFGYFSNNSNIKEEELRDLIKFCQGRPGIVFKFLENINFFLDFKKDIYNNIKIFQEDLSSRFKYFENFKTYDDFEKVLEKQFLIFRNLLIIQSGSEKDFPNLFLKDEFSRAAKKFSRGKIIEIIKFIQRLNRLFHDANFNYKLALEVLAMKV